jgi:hypothetical protein
MQPELPEPWRGFLAALDATLTTPVHLYCIGGFVVTACYGFPRPTADIDALAVLPGRTLENLVPAAGRGSGLHATHGVYLDIVTVVTCPDGYEGRLIELFPATWQHLRLSALDPYDLALAKLERNLQRDRDDVLYLAKVVPLDVGVLRERYHQELRPYLGRPEREDLTLGLWIDMIEESRRT